MTQFKRDPLHNDANASADAGRDAAYQQSISFLYDRINYEGAAATSSKYPFRLGRMAELVERIGLGHYLFDRTQSIRSCPPKPLIHIAGTKGKGSTAAIAASILTAAGYRTGLYTSPHLNELEERFRIDSVPCPKSTFVELVDEIRPVVASMDKQEGLQPTFFELTTALGMLYFDKRACQAIVLEVGLGGRLDSTNVFASSVAVITSIGLDHQNVLGDTLEEIAAEKAGIIKGGIPVVSAVLRPAAAEVIAQKAAVDRSTLYQLGRDFDVEATMENDWGSEVVFKFKAGFQRQPNRIDLRARLALEGAHQPGNAAAAIAAIDRVDSPPLMVSEEAIRRGLADVTSAARIERFDLPRSITGIVDAAHNEDSIAALVAASKSRFASQPLTIVFGASRDKKAEVMLGLLSPIADALVLTRYQGNPRYRDPHELFALLPQTIRIKTIVIDEPTAACDKALSLTVDGGVLVVCGSFFLAAETRPWMLAKMGAGTPKQSVFDD
ncbi:Folylpolyglutamate synthase [Novipirellula aureliae]|uniref:Dihydrofolate synthase/folylpolyglutamate synthase n=1 Tax=Novipirellula aureliae TaxID=2527966 RepID=A0A5C6E8N4_9BACT|nr:cyanophycin synthetase [Novipirellula aureliae]TWU44061.1 Folylpolyglutamate synthase [Novipirellula aureliae]